MVLFVGPTVKNSISTFMPQGEPNSKGVYSAFQMDAGTVLGADICFFMQK
jgi:hypothetical protein